MGFIDLGITHCVHPSSIVPEVFEDQRDKIKFHILRYIDQAFINRPDYYTLCQCLVAAGYIVGPVQEMKQLASDFDLEIQKLLASGRVTIDEDLLARIIAQNPEKYEYSYGDYVNIFSHYNGIHYNIRFIGNMLSEARDRCGWQFICDVGAEVVKSYRNGTLQCEMRDLELVLTEYFIGAFWLEGPNQVRVMEVANLYVELLENKDFYDAYMEKRELVRNNFAFLYNSPKLP